MEPTEIQSEIETLYEEYDARADQSSQSVREQTSIEVLTVLSEFLDALEAGTIQAVSQTDEGWEPVEWVNKGILLNFTLRNISTYEHGGVVYNDYLPLASSRDLGDRDTRNTPDGTILRRGAHVGSDSVLLGPSFVDIGAHVGSGSHVGACSSIGACAYVGDNVYLDPNTTIGGSLEPLDETPVIVEDGVTVRAGSQITGGTVVGAETTVGERTVLTPGMPVYDLVTEEILYGTIPSQRYAATRYVESRVSDHDLFDAGAYRPAVVATERENRLDRPEAL